ncbi:MAG: uncharacterized protein KVP18_000679 [Porospora cf. gigantea A]|nr:MAG: hypothetical protein KVP18_000679 [Porospora cf. gigantea A]
MFSPPTEEPFVMDSSKITPAEIIDGKLAGLPPWMQWSDRLPPPEQAPLDWRAPLGRVPFFMYDNEQWRQLTNLPFSCSYMAKPCAEFYFLHQLRHHPWRVYDPSKAVVMVLPIIVSDFLYPQRNWETKTQAKLVDAFKTIRELTKDFSSRTHVFYSGDWITRENLNRLRWNVTLGLGPKPVVAVETMDISSESAPKAVSFFNAGLSIRRPREIATILSRLPREQRPRQYRQRPLLFNMVGRADRRVSYYQRSQVFNLFKQSSEPSALVLVTNQDSLPLRFDLPNCDEGVPDPARWHGCKTTADRMNLDTADSLLRRSQVVLVVRGDDGGSQRIHQAASMGTLMALIGPAVINEGLPFHCLIPWKKVAYVFPDQSILETEEALKLVTTTVQSESQASFSARLRLYQRHIPDLVWELPSSRVGENILIEAAKRASPDELKGAGLSLLDFECVSGAADWRFTEFAEMDWPDGKGVWQ